MKLSDIKGDRVYEVVAGIIDPLYNIADDKEASRLFTNEARPEGVSKEKFAEMKIREGIPALIRNHKDDFTKILSLIEGVSEQEYLDNLTMSKFFGDVTSLVSDPQFRSLFQSAPAKTGGTASGDTRANTEDINP